MLTARLRELEAKRVVKREVLPTSPPLTLIWCGGLPFASAGETRRERTPSWLCTATFASSLVSPASSCATKR